MADKIGVILSKDRNAQPARERLQKDLVQELAGRAEVAVTVIPHLYDLAPDGPALRHLESTTDDLIVLAWLYPRSTYWVLDANGVRGRLGRTFSLPDEEPEELDTRASATELPDRTIWCFDLRTHHRAEPYVKEITAIAERTVAPLHQEAASPGAGQPNKIEQPTEARWYPVIDYGRCTNCLECLNFCLFGVYGLDASDALIAEQPDACRPGCPACARICPAGAIMFPEHNDPGIAGDPKASLEGLKLDLSQLFGGANPAELAAAERDRALAEKRHEEAESRSEETGRPPSKDDLDRLVDELDELDL